MCHILPNILNFKFRTEVDPFENGRMAPYVKCMWTTGQSAGSLHPTRPAMALPAMALPRAKGDVELYSVMLEVYLRAGFRMRKRRSLSLPGLMTLSLQLTLLQLGSKFSFIFLVSQISQKVHFFAETYKTICLNYLKRR